MKTKDVFGVIYLVFFLSCMIISYWIAWFFIIAIGVSCVISLIIFFYHDYKKDKRIEELERKVTALQPFPKEKRK